MKNIIIIRDTLVVKNIGRLFLKPLSWLYGLVTEIRNLLYERFILKSYTTKQFSIVVGNLTVGGTGKTPMVEFLIRLLKTDNQVVTLSRGYGRNTSGFVVASSKSTAAEIGDEPLQYYKKYGKECQIAVCENRIKGSEELFKLFPDHQILLLDDAFQHRALKPDLAILLNDFNRPFYHDEPFPGGRLRETRRGAGRADAVIVTKCPDTLDHKSKAGITKNINKYTTPGTPCYFSRVTYGPLLFFDNTEALALTVKIVAGIAQPGPFIQYIHSKYEVSGVKIFPDHHNYSLSDIEELIKNLENNQLILTTEKDMVKLQPLAWQAGLQNNFGYIPIQIDFGDDTAGFNEWLNQSVKIKAR